MEMIKTELTDYETKKLIEAIDFFLTKHNASYLLETREMLQESLTNHNKIPNISFRN